MVGYTYVKSIEESKLQNFHKPLNSFLYSLRLNSNYDYVVAYYFQISISLTSLLYSECYLFLIHMHTCY